MQEASKKKCQPSGMMMFHVQDAPFAVDIGNSVELRIGDPMDSSTLSVFMSINKLKELQGEIKGALKVWQRTQAQQHERRTP